MGVFTFVCRSSGDEWSAKQLSGDLEASAFSTYDLQRKLVQAALATDSSGGVNSSFSMVTPSSAVFQVMDLVSLPSPLLLISFSYFISFESHLHLGLG
ncbi:large ribosomal subunit protein P3 [Elaeis guineensis]|uniref:large ribosomal subunit protein P3 n=1 Tax=Elaeis guineensis var. tenera TaxID=51953 RepID=UPI003C6CFD06